MILAEKLIFGKYKGADYPHGKSNPFNTITCD
jgi:hypothetical protein